MTAPPLFDRLVFAATNLLIYLRHPAFTLYFRVQERYWPDFARPRGLSELVQWRKLFDRNPLFPILSDKLAAKRWISERDPALAVPETVWVGQRAEDLPAEFLAPGFVIKTNNSTSQNYFPHRDGTDRGSFERTTRRWQAGPLRRWLRDLRFPRYQWAYLPIEPRIFAERLIPAPRLVDISIRACNGVLLLASAIIDNKTPASRTSYFWVDGERFTDPTETPEGALPADFALPPAVMHAAVEHTKRLSQGIDYARVDFLAAGDDVYFSEMTLYPSAGYGGENWRTAIAYRFWLEHLHLSWPLATPQRGPKAVYLKAFRRWLDQQKSTLGPAERFAAQHGWRPAEGD